MAHRPDHAEDVGTDRVEHLDDDGADEFDATDIAAAMGFSSFGSQTRPSKKRRFNPLADAVVAAPSGGGSDGASTRAAASAQIARPNVQSSPPVAAQSQARLPVHSSPRPHKDPRKANADEIDLDLDDDEDGDPESADGVKAATAPDSDDDDRAPQYIDTSRPVGEVRHLGTALTAEEMAAEDAAAQARIDAIVAAGNAAYAMTAAPVTVPAPAPVPVPQQLDGSALSTARRTAGFQAADRHGFRPSLMPPELSEEGGGLARQRTDRPSLSRSSAGGDAVDDGFAGGLGPVSYRGGSFSSNHSSSRASGPPGRDRPRPPGSDWWTDYYDPTSNENPWAQLETSLGLSSCGTWLDRVPYTHGRRPSAASVAAAPS